jgi:hypothetical protein
MTVQPFVGRWPFFHLDFYTVCRSPCTREQPVARPLPTHRRTQTRNERTQTSMPGVGFEPTIPVFERTKTVHALDRVADRALAEAVIPTLRPGFESRSKSCGICGGQSGAGTGFLRVLRVSMPADLHSTNFSTIAITYHLGLVILIDLLY